MKALLLICLMAIGISIQAQVAVNTDGSAPDNSAMLDLKSTSKGMLVPRMTLPERDAISSPATGLMVFCTDNNCFYANKGTPATPNWVMMSSQWLSNGSNIYFTGGNVGLGLSTPAYLFDVAGDINFSGTIRKNGISVVTGVSGVTATLPLLSSGGGTPNITIQQANTTMPGFLSSSDWNLFNAKQNALSFGNVSSGDMTITGGAGAVIGSGMNLAINKGNLTESTSSVLTITSGTNAVLGAGTSIQVKKANTNQSGYLSITDWNNFNSKVSSQWVTNGANISYTTGKVGIGNSTPVNSAALEVNSTTSGFLPPRMTTAQRNAIASPAEGLVVYNTDEKALNMYNGTAWSSMTPVPGFVCGLSITINHLVSRGVAPVNKTVNYGTVTNIPGEPTKCWITSNLGADHQATAVNDATEASAGWYWQFNRMQGYKHDGTTRTPNTTWISSIDENLDWQTANDPCLIELGTGWRLPTYTEWYNVDNTGGWTSWTGPWNSGLKMHVAGCLYYSSGSLNRRGSSGHNWGSTQNDATYGWYLYFDSLSSNMDNTYFKAYGFSLRCLRD